MQVSVQVGSPPLYRVLAPAKTPHGGVGAEHLYNVRVNSSGADAQGGGAVTRPQEEPTVSNHAPYVPPLVDIDC